MKILCFDVETTGLPKFKNDGVSRYYDPCHTKFYDSSRVVSISWILSDDKDHNILSTDNFIVKPDKFIIPQFSINIHNITNNMAHTKGKNMRYVLDQFYEDICLADILVGHNVEFDINVIKSEMFRYNKINMCTTMDEKIKQCTLQIGQKFLNIGFRPKLEFLFEKLFNEKPKNCHNSLYDSLYSMNCYFEMKEKQPHLFNNIY
jgi:DNA polymerase-3 subunit alpha